jgi:hypothetical protein
MAVDVAGYTNNHLLVYFFTPLPLDVSEGESLQTNLDLMKLPCQILILPSEINSFFASVI